MALFGRQPQIGVVGCGKQSQLDTRMIAGAATGSMTDAAALSMAPVQGVIGEAQVIEAGQTLQEYKGGKSHLENRIIENNKWWKLQHWDVVNKGTAESDAKQAADVKPVSAWLFNSLANKHASAMDSYPEPNILPREEADELDAEDLSQIVPVILERNEFEETYSDAWWYKLKIGTVPYGVFWDKSKSNGLGDISVKKLDLLNIFWEPGISKIQDTPNLFIVSLVDRKVMKSMYPWVKDNETTTLTIADYVHDESIDKSKKVVVVDWYYKLVNANGRTILHYAKFVGNTLLFASENDPVNYPNGFYDHGQYPVVFDVLFPEEDSPVGFGYIDIMKEPQIYIDKMDQIILKNALMAGKKRWFTRDDGSVNEQEYANWALDFVHVKGSLDEKSIKEIVVDPLDAFIITHKQMKIDELKETSSDRDFQQGGTVGGVTAASAIAALQEAGNKRDRDTIKGSYRAFNKIVGLVIENDRQFYDEPRNFRIIGEEGAVRYIQHSNERLKMQPLPLSAPGADPGFRIPIFDIKISAQRANPFNRAAQNELAMALYGNGFFDPARAPMALLAIKMMDFEGKAAIEKAIAQNGQLFQQLQQALAYIQQLLGVGPDGKPPQNDQGEPSKGTDGKTQTAAVSNVAQQKGIPA